VCSADHKDDENCDCSDVSTKCPTFQSILGVNAR
jgi:hypothetical protein